MDHSHLSINPLGNIWVISCFFFKLQIAINNNNNNNNKKRKKKNCLHLVNGVNRSSGCVKIPSDKQCRKGGSENYIVLHRDGG